MRLFLVCAVAVLLQRGDPKLFAWNVTGFHTFLVFCIILVVVSIVPGRHSG